jgi:patatin-like phospholipase/acyl hydrolase
MTPHHSRPEQIRPFRVLALDGGGVRGLYSASLLATLSERFSGSSGGGAQEGTAPDIGSGFDLIAGTSTGGILACALAAGLPINRVIDLYCQHGPAIFLDPMPQMSDGLIFWKWCWRHRKTAGNSAEPLRKALVDLFGNTTLKDLYHRRYIALCIPSVHVLKETARVFKTPHDPDRTLDGNTKVVDVCLATAAAPIFLPLATVPASGNGRGAEAFADGGLWANNPVLVGLIEALRLTEPEQAIEIISIGTSAVPAGSVLSASELNRGLAQWRVGAEALSLSMNAQASGAHHIAQLLAEQMGRLCKSICVYRVPESAPSPQHIQHLGLDRASEKALDTLMQLGRSDGLNMHSSCLRSDDAGPKMVRRVFDSIAARSSRSVTSL